VHFNKIYIAGCCGSAAEAVCTREIRGKAASPTVFLPLLREAGSNWYGQGVSASMGMKSGVMESLRETERKREIVFNSVSRSGSF